MIESWLLGATITTIASLIAFGLVLFYFDPETSGWLGLVLLLLTFLVSFLGTLTIFGYRLRPDTNTDFTGKLIASFRQAVLATVLAAVLLILSRFHLYHAWHLVVGVILALSLEIYLQLRVKYKKPNSAVQDHADDDI